MHERRGREDGHRRREKAETITPRVWLDYTIIGVADDVLVVLTLRERNWSDRSTAGEERSRRASQYDRKVLGSMGGGRRRGREDGLKRTVLVAVGGPAIQALITTVELARR